MPIDGNCFQEMAVVVPITGASTYNAGSYFIINIPRSGPNCVFDPANSFLRFNVWNTDTTASVTLDHSADNLIQTVEVLLAGNVLEIIDNYQILVYCQL